MNENSCSAGFQPAIGGRARIYYGGQDARATMVDDLGGSNAPTKMLQ